MIRNGRAFFISVVLHTAIAAVAIFALQRFQKEPPGEEAKLCIALAHFTEPVAKAPDQHPPSEPSPPKKAAKPEPAVKKAPPPVVEKHPEPKPVEEPAPAIAREVQEIVPEEVEPLENPADAGHDEALPETTEKERELADTATPEAAPAQQRAPEPVPAPSAGERYLQQHLAVIAQLLQEHLYYPRIARKRGITGDVLVSFELLGSGEAVRVSVLSGETDILNRAAVTTIERLSGRFPKPDAPITLKVPICYSLR